MSTHPTDARRPWPIPSAPWIMSMTWRDLLFAHWTVEADLVRRHIPRALELDLFDGRAWVGAVPFLMENTAPRFVPPIPGLHAFPELNLRTYVISREGKPGVWFFSLDAGSKLAVRTARAFFYLPYFDAEFEISVGDPIVYRSQRTHRGAAKASFDVSYKPTSAVYRAETGSLDSWLTDRYCLYSADTDGQVYRGEIDHDPWPLQTAEAEIRVNTLGDWLGMPLDGPPETLHFARRLDVHAWLIQPIGNASGPAKR